MPYIEKYKGSVANSLTPTFENVAMNFATETIREGLFNKKKVNFNFVFQQPEAIPFLERVMEKYIAEFYSGFKEEAISIIETLKKVKETRNNLPSLIIKDYQLFFELLRQYYEKYIILYFQRTEMSGFPTYEMVNCFEHLWLRATPEDFNNPEAFLQRQVQIINDTTFSKYDNEMLLGPLSYFNDHIICISNEFARTWDEMPWEFKIIIYDKKYYYQKELFDKPHYTLPVIRYGIYEKDGRKICRIGAIQSMEEEASSEVSSAFNRARYKVNKNIPDEEFISDAEPSHVIALSIFINFLHNEGITEIEAPGMYVLDYQYHQKRNVTLVEQFKNDWSKYNQKLDPERYLKKKERLQRKLNKEDLISKSKTERFIGTFIRLMHHYPQSEIESLAGELDNYFHINIPVVHSENEINGDLLGGLYLLVKGIYAENKNDIVR